MLSLAILTWIGKKDDRKTENIAIRQMHYDFFLSLINTNLLHIVLITILFYAVLTDKWLRPIKCDSTKTAQIMPSLSCLSAVNVGQFL